MPDLFPAIQSLTPADVAQEVEAALRDEFDADAIQLFLSSVEWGSYKQALPEVREMMGNLEGWSTAYAEHELSESDYIELLSALVAGTTQPVTA